MSLSGVHTICFCSTLLLFLLRFTITIFKFWSDSTVSALKLMLFVNAAAPFFCMYISVMTWCRISAALPLCFSHLGSLKAFLPSFLPSATRLDKSPSPKSTSIRARTNRTVSLIQSVGMMNRERTYQPFKHSYPTPKPLIHSSRGNLSCHLPVVYIDVHTLYTHHAHAQACLTPECDFGFSITSGPQSVDQDAKGKAVNTSNASSILPRRHLALKRESDMMTPSTTFSLRRARRLESNMI